MPLGPQLGAVGAQLGAVAEGLASPSGAEGLAAPPRGLPPGTCTLKIFY